MEENLSSTALIDISRYCSSFAEGDLWSSSQSSCSRSPIQRIVSPTATRSSESDSPILPLPPSSWSLTSSFANIQLDSSLSSLWSTNQKQICNCCRCTKNSENWSENLQTIRSNINQDEKSSISLRPIQRPSPLRQRTNPSTSLSIFDDEENSNHKIENNDEDETLRLHVSNIPFTWSKEKLAQVFGKYGTTFDVEVVYNERGSKGFGFVTFLAKKDALEAKRRMDREIVDGRRLVVNFAKPKQKSSGSSKEAQQYSFKNNSNQWKINNSTDRPTRMNTNHYQSLGFSTPPTARRQHLAGFSSLSSTPTRSSNSHRYYL